MPIQEPSARAPGAAVLRRSTRPVDQTGLWRWLPGLYVLRHYRPRWVLNDLLAGLVLTAILVPVGMGYAEASGLPAINGLYATIVPLLCYALFGPSRILVLGPDSGLAAVILAVTLPLANGDPARIVPLAGMLAIFSGIMCVAAGVARLGFITELLSKPIRYGYLNGIALTVLVSQLPKLCGFSASSSGVIEGGARFAQGVLDGKANVIAVIVGGVTLIVILVLKRFKRIPYMLIAVVGATAITAIFNLSAWAGLAVVGVLPQGLPAFAFPSLQPEDFAPLLTGAIAIAVVAFADTSVLSRTYAEKTGAYVDPNQESIGLGLANVAAGLFQGFSISSSASRTPVAESAGAKSQLTGVFGALAIALLLLFVPGLLQNLPSTALGAIVIASALGMFEWRDLRRLYRIQRWEFWLSVVCFVGVAVFGPIPGILFSIGVALLEYVWDGWRPHYAVLGRADGVKGYHDITRYPKAARVPGLVLFRWDAQIFFANAEMFHGSVLDAIAAAPTPVRRVVVASEPVTSVDITGADMLAEFDDDLRKAGIELMFAEMKDPVKDKLKRFGLYTRFGEDRFFATLSEAVNTYLKTTGVEWVDWEDRI